MLDYKELSPDGNDLELLTRELLVKNGLEVFWSGKGSDGGKDLLCIEHIKSIFGSTHDVNKRWIVQCKHKAKSGKALGLTELKENVVNICRANNADGYILVCTTYISSGLTQMLDNISKENKIDICIWDGKKIESECLKPSNWDLLTMFFPKSSKKIQYKISNVGVNFWQIFYKGYSFYFSLRLSSNIYNFIYVLDNIIKQLNIIDKKINGTNCVRLRAISYDDKNCNYMLFFDIVIERSNFEKNKNDIMKKIDYIKNGIDINGQYYEVDIKFLSCDESSDHFDIDHCDFYTPYLTNFECGFAREESEIKTIRRCDLFDTMSEEEVNHSYNRLYKTINKLNFVTLYSSNNSKIEKIDNFSNNLKLNDIFDENDIGNDIFCVSFRFECKNFIKLKKLVNIIPQEIGARYFELEKNFVVTPWEGLRKDNNIYSIKFYVSSHAVSSKKQYRLLLNEYIDKVSDVIIANFKKINS